MSTVCFNRLTVIASGLLLIILHLHVSTAGIHGNDAAASSSSASSSELPERPEFDEAYSTNATATVGGSIILNCRVQHIGSRQVSWGRGFEVLTGGLMVFADGRRFQALHHNYSNDWALRIRSLRPDDEGWYFCQVGSEPPVSHRLYLRLVDPQVRILGGPELHINRASAANLTCVIEGGLAAPARVRWTHNDKLAEYDSTRSGVSVHTRRAGLGTVSTLLIARTLHSDAGLYFCEPDGVRSARISVIVVNGDQPAAMQTGCQASMQYCWLFLLFSLLMTAWCPLRQLHVLP